jgi:hypothetical protein
VEARFSAPVQTGPGAYPASCTMGTGSFPGVKRPGRGVDHPPPSSAEVKERIELYLYSPSGPTWPVLGRTLTLSLLCGRILLERTLKKQGVGVWTVFDWDCLALKFFPYSLVFEKYTNKLRISGKASASFPS